MLFLLNILVSLNLQRYQTQFRPWWCHLGTFHSNLQFISFLPSCQIFALNPPRLFLLFELLVELLRLYHYMRYWELITLLKKSNQWLNQQQIKVKLQEALTIDNLQFYSSNFMLIGFQQFYKSFKKFQSSNQQNIWFRKLLTKQSNILQSHNIHILILKIERSVLGRCNSSMFHNLFQSHDVQRCKGSE